MRVPGGGPGVDFRACRCQIHPMTDPAAPLALSPETEAEIGRQLDEAEAEIRAGHFVPLSTARAKIRAAMARLEARAAYAGAEETAGPARRR